MTNTKTYKSSAPGSLMLLGEHAVLHGRRALVCAINRRISIELIPSSNNRVRIMSALGEYDELLEDFPEHPSFKFVLQAIRQHRHAIPSGFSLKIDSGFSADIGFGSSAAVTVATHAALTQWTKGALDRNDLFTAALETVHAVQGRGSGADLAASVFGGVVAFSTEPTFDPVSVSVPLTAVYCGYKTPTTEVIEKVEGLRRADPDKYERIYAEIDTSVGLAVDALRAKNIQALGQILNRNNELMDEMGVNTPELTEIVKELQSNPNISGAKISGSGLGDCAVGLGHAELPFPANNVYNLGIEVNGVLPN